MSHFRSGKLDRPIRGRRVGHGAQSLEQTVVTLRADDGVVVVESHSHDG